MFSHDLHTLCCESPWQWMLTVTWFNCTHTYAAIVMNFDIYYCSGCIKTSNPILVTTIGTMHAWERYKQYHISTSLVMVYCVLIREHDGKQYLCTGKLTITSGVKLQYKVAVSWSWKCSPMWQTNAYKIKDTLFKCMKVRWLGCFFCKANDRS